MWGKLLQTGRVRWLLVATILVHGCLLYVTLTRQADGLFNDAVHRIGPATDFRALYNAGLAWRSGQPIYGQGPGFGYRYHPFSAMSLFAVLSSLPPKFAYYIWLGLVEVLLVVALNSLRRRFRRQDHFDLWLLGVVCASPLYLELYMGNATLAAVALLVLAFDEADGERSIASIVFFIISCLVKPIGLFVLPLFILRRGIRVGAVSLGTLVVLAVPYLLREPLNCQTAAFLNCTDKLVLPGFLVHAGNQGLYALIARLGSWAADIPLTTLHSVSQLSTPFFLLLSIWPFLLTSLATIMIWRHRQDIEVASMLPFLLLTFLLSYKEVWEHSYSIMVFVAPMLWTSATADRKVILAGFLILAFPTPFVFYDIPFIGERLHDPDWVWSPAISVLHHAIKPAGAAMLWLSIVKGGASGAPNRRNRPTADSNLSRDTAGLTSER